MTNVDINGRTHDLRADPATPLLYVLRNDLKLKGTRFGCGALLGLLIGISFALYFLFDEALWGLVAIAISAVLNTNVSLPAPPVSARRCGSASPAR